MGQFGILCDQLPIWKMKYHSGQALQSQATSILCSYNRVNILDQADGYILKEQSHKAIGPSKDQHLGMGSATKAYKMIHI